MIQLGLRKANNFYNLLIFMLSKIIRIEKTTEKSAYVKDNITKEILPITDNEFKGENITHYRLIIVNYFEIGFFTFPIEGRLDRVIPFWFWSEKEAIPSKYVDKKRILDKNSR